MTREQLLPFTMAIAVSRTPKMEQPPDLDERGLLSYTNADAKPRLGE